jgi:hypothetical protein
VRSELFGGNLEVSTPGEVFALQNSRMLRVALDGEVMARQGSMIAYQGEVDFERIEGASAFAGGLFNTILQGTGWAAITANGSPVGAPGRRPHLRRRPGGHRLERRAADQHPPHREGRRPGRGVGGLLDFD